MKHLITPTPLFVICAAAVLLMACVPRETNEVDSSSSKSSADVKIQVASVQKTYAEKKQLSIKAKRRPEMLARMAPALLYQQEFFVDQIEESREIYQHFTDNEIFKSSDNPVSTFSVDVDTGAYSNVRRFLNQGQLP